MKKKVLVLGFGSTGQSYIKYFSNINQELKVFDTRSSSQFKNTYKGIDVYFKNMPQDILNNIDEVYISPGFDPNHAIVKEINQKSIKIFTDIDLFKEKTKSKIISVTGTNGKTTVVSMIEHVLNNHGISCIACGNNGVSPLSIINSSNEFTVLELSSYQLEYMKNFHSYASLLTNVTPDHLERHNSFKEYLRIKELIFSQSRINFANNKLRNNLTHKNVKFYGYDSTIKKCFLDDSIIETISIHKNKIQCNGHELGYSGTHNLYNILSVFIVLSNLSIDINESDIIRHLKTFKALPHRIEYICSFNNVEWFNDSKSTNCESTIAALEALEKNIILIIGGSIKQINYKKLSKAINTRVRLIIFVGENKDILKNELEFNHEFFDVTDYNEAVKKASNFARSGDKVLLSPASPSFDMFDDFEHRGNVFKEEVKKLVS